MSTDDKQNKIKYDDQPVRSFRRFLKCPTCGDGHVEFTGETFLCNPPKYKHKCIQCNIVFSSDIVTGQIMHEYIAESAKNV